MIIIFKKQLGFKNHHSIQNGQHIGQTIVVYKDDISPSLYFFFSGNAK